LIYLAIYIIQFNFRIVFEEEGQCLVTRIEYYNFSGRLMLMS